MADFTVRKALKSVLQTYLGCIIMVGMVAPSVSPSKRVDVIDGVHFDLSQLKHQAFDK